MQKRASQVLIYQKNVQKRAKMCKIVQKRAKTCISNIFGPNLKTCTCEVRAAWGRVSGGVTVSAFPQGISKLRLESSKGHASFIKNTAVHIPNQLSYLKRRKSSWKLFIDGTGQPLDNLDISFTFSILNYVFLNIYHLFLWISFFQNSTISYKSYSQYSLYDVLIILKSKSFGMENYW